MAHSPIDPESEVGLNALLEFLPGGLGAIPSLEDRRALLQEMSTAEPLPPNANVAIENRIVDGTSDNPDLRLRIYQPTNGPAGRPGILMIHGGGMIMGSVEAEDYTASMLCESLTATVISVDYRLAPEHPHPTPVEDCFAAWAWLNENLKELGVDPARVAFYGESAGGGLVLGLALLARDRGAPLPAFIAAIYPMIDDSNSTPSSYEVTDVGSWDRAINIEAWNWYLAGQAADQYAAPSRAEDVSGLPPVFLDVGTVDLFRDETISFAQRLMAAGNPCELHVYPGAYHGSELVAPTAALSQRITSERIAALTRALTE